MTTGYPGRGTEGGWKMLLGASPSLVFLGQETRMKKKKKGDAGTSDVYYVLILEIQGHEAMAYSIKEEENPAP